MIVCKVLIIVINHHNYHLSYSSLQLYRAFLNTLFWQLYYFYSLSLTAH